MYIFKKLVSVVCVLCLLMSMSIPVLAADHSAGTFDEMETAFITDTDPVVNIDVTNDIDFGDRLLWAEESQSYNISSQNDSTLNKAGFIGGGSVNITTDVVSNDETPALMAFDGCNVSVTGDVTAEGTGVYVNNATVTVTGNVSGEEEGIYAVNNATVNVTGNVSGGNTGISTYDSTVLIDGNVSGADGNPDDVDLTKPDEFSDGGMGIHAIGSTVTVTGDISGGDSYGTYGWAGHGIYAENTDLNVGGSVSGGDVIADPDTIANEDAVSSAGFGAIVDNASNVNIAGNVIGGNTSGDSGIGGSGMEVALYPYPEEMTGSITVTGTVSGGEASTETGTNGVGMIVYQVEGSGDEITDGNIPAISVGACDSIEVYVESEEIESAIAESITVTGLPAEVEYVEYVEESKVDPIWNTLHRQLRNAQKGDTITIDLGSRTYISGYLLDLARQLEVTLVIQWDGGDDITVKPDFEGDVANRIVQLTELAEMVK